MFFDGPDFCDSTFLYHSALPTIEYFKRFRSLSYRGPMSKRDVMFFYFSSTSSLKIFF